LPPDGQFGYAIFVTHPDKGIPSEFSWLNDLNPQQQAAVMTGNGPVLVVAGAGTGKTKTLAYHVAHLVCTGVDPGRIMLLTFTRRAAEEMIRRANAIVRIARPETSPRATRVWGGTFHSVANRLLRIYSKAVGLEESFTVLDQADAEDLMNVVRHESGLSEKEKRFPRKATCLAIYSRCVNSSDPLDDTLKTYFPWCREWEKELKGLFKSYVDAKHARNVLDYDDLLLFWHHLLADEEIAKRIDARFDHILIDEYQDTNRLQAGILQRMRRTNKNIMVVGDDAQSIYSFRAADIRNILDFPNQFPGTKQITLEQNYRSCQPILDSTNQIIALARDRYSKDLWSARGGDQKPLLVTCEREEEQTDYVVRRILEHYEQGIPLRRQAVLFRVGYWSDHLEVELTRRKIPFHKYGGLKFLEAAHVKDLLSFLRILENPRDQLAWSRVLNLLDGIGPAIAARAFAFVRDRGFDPRVIAQFEGPKASRDSIRRLGELFHELTAGGDKRVPLAGQVEGIRRFYEPILMNVYENPEPRRRDLEQLEHIAGGYRSRRKFLTDLTLDPPTSTADFAGPPTLDDDWLTLSTIHSAKGCEWDVVYLIHATDGVLPSDLATGDAAQIEEERRLLYVACTRAKDWLYVLFPLRYYHRKHRLGDGHGYAQLTRFIPPPVAQFFDHGRAVADPGEEEIAGRPSAARDIRKSIRSMWD
jgi:DNA helicase-2/ATP-dependent DNA helicase PcrA